MESVERVPLFCTRTSESSPRWNSASRTVLLMSILGSLAILLFFWLNTFDGLGPPGSTNLEAEVSGRSSSETIEATGSKKFLEKLVNFSRQNTTLLPLLRETAVSSLVKRGDRSYGYEMTHSRRAWPTFHLPLPNECTASLENLTSGKRLQYSTVMHRSCKYLPPPLEIAENCGDEVQSTVTQLSGSFKTKTSSLRSFVLFIANSHSGHSLIGSFLDSHPSVIVSNEADVFGRRYKIDHRRGDTNMSRDDLFRAIYNNSLSCALFSRFQHDYNYTVPHGYNGLFEPGNLRVIGDKKGQATAHILERWKKEGNLVKKWRAWEDYVDLPIRIIHVWWANPAFRQIHLLVAGGKNTEAFEFNNTAFVLEDAIRERMLQRLFKFLELPFDRKLAELWKSMLNKNKVQIDNTTTP